MIYQDIKKGGHIWEKQNLITKFSKRGAYDIYRCSKCGLTGISRQLGRIEIDGRRIKIAQKCPHATHTSNKGRTIKITRCTAIGKAFENCIPNSVHKLITPPSDRPQDEYWIQGVGEPVRLLIGEFIFIDE